MKLNFMEKSYILYFAYLVAFIEIETVIGDRFSGLCPSGYPRRVVHNRTGYCYVVGSQGPCGRMAVIASDPFNRNFGTCKCKDYGSSHCFGRPLIQNGENCYFAYGQGPCKKGQWFVKNKYGRAECQKNPCPIIENQRDLLYTEFPENDFYFMMKGSKKCWKTGSQAFCPKGHRAYFLGTDPEVQCLTYDPYNCNYVAGSDFESYGQSKSQSMLAFGVPYEGI